MPSFRQKGQIYLSVHVLYLVIFSVSNIRTWQRDSPYEVPFNPLTF
jgi:hypothetical protein